MLTLPGSNMWVQGQDSILFVACTVFLGGNTSEQSAIYTNSKEIRRLLLYRLEVLEAALLMLANLQSEAALEPDKAGIRHP